MPSASQRLLIVGASMAGLRAAEAARKGGYTDEITVVGDEPWMPYNRPPLSKTAQPVTGGLADVTFRVPPILRDVRWLLGTAAVGADLDVRVTYLADGTALEWDAMIAATGVRPRHLPLDSPMSNRVTIRTWNDALQLRSLIRSGARVVVLGAGFIGCEVASAARAAGAQVHVVAPEAQPMLAALGHELAAAVRARHESRGVRFHLETVAGAFDADERIRQVALSDGSRIDADVVIEAIGCRPNTEWLQHNRLDLTDGIACDADMRAVGRYDLFAAGDIARFPNELFDGVARRVEHWSVAVDTARRAGTAAAVHLRGGALSTPFLSVPSFWSDQAGTRLQSFGLPTLGTEDARILEGHPGEDVAFGYYSDARLVGVVMLGMAHRHAHFRSLLIKSLGRDLLALA